MMIGVASVGSLYAGENQLVGSKGALSAISTWDRTMLIKVVDGNKLAVVFTKSMQDKAIFQLQENKGTKIILLGTTASGEKINISHFSLVDIVRGKVISLPLGESFVSFQLISTTKDDLQLLKSTDVMPISSRINLNVTPETSKRVIKTAGASLPDLDDLSIELENSKLSTVYNNGQQQLAFSLTSSGRDGQRFWSGTEAQLNNLQFSYKDGNVICTGVSYEAIAKATSEGKDYFPPQCKDNEGKQGKISFRTSLDTENAFLPGKRTSSQQGLLSQLQENLNARMTQLLASDSNAPTQKILYVKVNYDPRNQGDAKLTVTIPASQNGSGMERSDTASFTILDTTEVTKWYQNNLYINRGGLLPPPFILDLAANAQPTEKRIVITGQPDRAGATGNINYQLTSPYIVNDYGYFKSLGAPNTHASGHTYYGHNFHQEGGLYGAFYVFDMNEKNKEYQSLHFQASMWAGWGTGGLWWVWFKSIQPRVYSDSVNIAGYDAWGNAFSFDGKPLSLSIHWGGIQFPTEQRDDRDQSWSACIPSGALGVTNGASGSYSVVTC